MPQKIPYRKLNTSGLSCQHTAVFMVAAIAVFCLFLPDISGSADIVIGAGDERISLNGRMEVLRDPAGTLTIGDVTTNETSSRFTPLERRLSLGYTDDTIWLRFTIRKSADSVADEWWLQIVPLFLDHLTLFIPANAAGTAGRQSYTQRESGDMIPERERDFPGRDLGFRVPLDDMEPRTFYLRVRTTSTVLVDAELWRPSSYAVHEATSSFFVGSFYGVLVILMIFNAVLWSVFRERLYLLYALLLLNLGIIFFIGNGCASVIGFPTSPEVIHMILGLSMPALIITGTLLLEAFVPLGKRELWRLSLIAVRWIAGACIIMVAAGQFRIVAPVIQAVGLFVGFACIAVSILGIFRNVPSARLYAVTFFIYYAGIIAVTVRNIGVLDLESPLQDWAFQFGSAIHMVLIQVAIVLRFHRIESERKKMEEEVVKAHRLDSVSMLAGGIAHDFNNMLTIIMSTTTLARLYGGENVRVVAKLDEAEKEIIRARELTNQLLTFTKGGAPVKRPFSLSDIIRDTVEFSTKGAAVKCVMEIAPDLCPAEIDPVQISQVLSNLVINAVQAMPNGGTVRVSAFNEELTGTELPVPAGKYVHIVVDDSGVGINPEYIGRIFDPFFTTKEVGKGLGLSTSYSIVKRHGGYIDVQSRPGEGSVFSFWLPASSETVIRRPRQESPAPQGAGRVLVMDDEQKILESTREMLQVLGYEAEVARNGKEAVILYKRAIAHGRPFDAVMLDLTVMGGMGGRECMKEIQSIDPGVRAVVMSGYAADSTLAEFAQHGFLSALPKPFTASELGEALKIAINRGDKIR